MNTQILYRGLKDLIANQPNWEISVSGNSEKHHEWLGKAFALLKRWNLLKAELMNGNVSYIFMGPVERKFGLTAVLNVINQAIQDLELDLPDEPQQIFGPGAVYDFYKELNDLFKSAQKSIMIIDPYMDAEIFEGYISRINDAIEVSLLTSHHVANLKIALQKYVSQNKRKVVAKSSSNLHDRILIIDNINCWALGQSIKDAAKSKQTYMVPITDENSKLKIDHYLDLFKIAIDV